MFVCPSLTFGTLCLSSILHWALQNAFLDELFGTGPALKTFLEAVSPHVKLELLLVSLKGRCSCRVWEDVSLYEILTLGARRETFLEVVCGTLALQLESFGLKGSSSA